MEKNVPLLLGGVDSAKSGRRGGFIQSTPNKYQHQKLNPKTGWFLPFQKPLDSTKT
jgi:hypothetical protein